MVSKSSPTKDIDKIICCDRSAVFRLKMLHTVAHFGQLQFDTSVANLRITINAFVLNGWQCEVGGKNPRALIASYPALTFFLKKVSCD